MKDYKAMAESVFRRRDAYIQKKRTQKEHLQRIAAIGAASLTLCLLCVTLIQKGSPDVQQSAILSPEQSQSLPQENITEETESAILEETNPNALLLLANDNGSEIAETVLRAHITLPLGYTITVTDLREMDEEDASTLYHRLNRDLSNRLTQDTFSSAGITRGANMALTVTQTGCFKLEMADRSSVSSIHAECVSEYGEVQFYILKDNLLANDWHPHWNKLSISGEEFAAIDPDAQLAIAWHHSIQMVAALDKAPDMPLSCFSDRLIITVNYRDGSAEVLAADIRFSDEGSAVIEYAGSVYYSAENNM